MYNILYIIALNSEIFTGFRKGRLYFQRVVEDVKQRNHEDTATRMTINSFTKYHLKFISNRVTTRTAHKALQMVSTHSLEYYFETCVVEDYAANGRLQKMGVVAQQEFEFQDPKISENNEQVSAIKNIVNCSAYPSPHIIFGPPGMIQS